MIDRVLTRRLQRSDSDLTVDRGVLGLVQALTKLSHTRSALYVMAHPDDEDAATLTYLARGEGVRTAIFSLTRGESGDNAVGAEAGAALGALRTEEMLAAAEAYGVEDVYFGTCQDYGYSKRVEEAWQRWGEARVVRDIARAIRIAQPDVVISRFSGEKSDGHAHHRAVGLATRKAFELAGEAMPELEAEGLAPHRASRLYVEVASAAEGTLAVPVYEVPPWLGMSYAEIGARGHALHRTQTAGKRVLPAADAMRFYRLVTSDATAARDSTVPSAAAYPAYKAASEGSSSIANRFLGFHDGLRSGIKTIFPDHPLRGRYHAQLETALHGIDVRDLSHAVPNLSEMLSLVRRGTACTARDVLEEHIIAALAIALGIRVHAIATSSGDSPPKAFYEPFIGMDDVVLPGKFTVDVDVRGPAPQALAVTGAAEDGITSAGGRRFLVEAKGKAEGYFVRAEYNSMGVPFALTVPVCARNVAAPHGLRVLRRRRDHGPTVDMRVPRWPTQDPEGRNVVRVGTSVGVIDGTGDCIGAAAQMLGAEVRAVSPDLGHADVLHHLDVLVLGVRAYARHAVLANARQAITDFAQAGGHVVVFMQSPEFDPARHAPHPAVLPQEPAEVCEEDAVVTLLGGDHPLLTTPNALNSADFAHWIEQRGSKLWSRWAAEYTPLVETHDTGEAEQRGLWLTAKVGKGSYTYCALALHRQLPFGVPGAWRILGNLLARKHG